MSEQELAAIVAENITRYLEERGMEQKDLAKAIGVSPASVSGWCAGNVMPRPDKLDAMSQIFGCSRKELLAKRSTSEVERLAEELKSREDFQQLIAAVRDLPVDKLQLIIDIAHTMIDKQVRDR